MCGRNDEPLFKRLEGLTFTLFLLILPLCSSGQEELTLEKALEITEKNSYSAEMGALDKQLAAQDIKQSLALYYPKIDASMGHVHLDNDPAFKFGPVTFPAGEQLFWKWDFSIQQTIWDFGRRKEIVKASEDSEKAVNARVNHDVKMKQIEMAGAFLEALTIQRQLGVLDVKKTFLSDHLQVAADLFKQGVVTRNEVLRTDVALRSLEDQKRQMESAHISALDKLKISLGVDMETDITLVDPTMMTFSGAAKGVNSGGGRVVTTQVSTQEVQIEELDLLPQIKWQLDEMETRALQNNEKLVALSEKINALADAANFARKDSYPYFVGGIGHSYEQNRYMAYPHVNRLFLGVSVNLFDGGARKAKMEKARIEVEKAKREKLEEERKLTIQLTEAYRNYSNAIKEYETAQQNAYSAFENLRIVEDQYKEGLLKTTDFLEAEAIFTENRFKEVQGLYKVIALEVNILALMGEDLKTFFSDKN
jgi:outer membrane protein